jgi:hypothetical protein
MAGQTMAGQGRTDGQDRTDEEQGAGSLSNKINNKCMLI